MLSFLFKNRSADPQKLACYGFKREGEEYVYAQKILGGEFVAEVRVGGDGVSAKVFDAVLGDEYTLHLVESASGEFVGRVRAEYERILGDIAEKCFDSNMYVGRNREIIRYIKETFGDSLEFLWQDLPDAAIVRRKDNRKWYALFMKISPAKLGLGEGAPADILNVRFAPEEIAQKIDNTAFFGGYHMNKKHWLTVLLSAPTPTEEILRLVDASYEIAGKKK